jgi:hypothetical protein
MTKDEMRPEKYLQKGFLKSLIHQNGRSGKESVGVPHSGRLTQRSIVESCKHREGSLLKLGLSLFEEYVIRMLIYAFLLLPIVWMIDGNLEAKISELYITSSIILGLIALISSIILIALLVGGAFRAMHSLKKQHRTGMQISFSDSKDNLEHIDRY